MNIYGRAINLYGSKKESTEKESGHFLKIDDDNAEFGHTENYLRLTTDNTSTNVLSLKASNTNVNLSRNLTTLIGGTTTATFGNVTNVTYNSSNKSSSNSALGISVNGYVTATTSGYLNAKFGAVSEKDTLNSKFKITHSTEFKMSSDIINLKKNILYTSTAGEQSVKEAGLSFSGNAGSAKLNIHSYGGAEIGNSGTGGLRIYSKGVGIDDGVWIGAVQDNNYTDKDSFDGKHYPYLKLYARSDGESIFSLSSNKGYIEVRPDLSIGYPYEDPTGHIGWAKATNFNAVVANHYYTPGAGIFAGTLDGQNDNSNGSRLLGCSVYAQNGVIAKKFMMNPNNSGDYMHWYQTGGWHSDLTGQGANNIQTVLEWLRAEIEAVRNETRNYANDRANQAESNAKSYAEDEANAAYNNARSYANNNFSRLGHTHSEFNNYVSKSTFNNHRHLIESATATPNTQAGGNPSHVHVFSYNYPVQTYGVTSGYQA